MKNTMKITLVVFIHLILFLSACNSTQPTPTITTETTLIQQITSTITPNKPAETKLPAPTSTPITTAVSTTPPTSLPVFPDRQLMPYFNLLPEFEDLPGFFSKNFVRTYEAAEYEDHYTLRVIYQGNHHPQDQYYLGITLTVAHQGFFNPEQLSKNYINSYPMDFPTLGEDSAVLSGTRQFAWVLDGERYLEVSLVGGGNNTFTPEMVYQIIEAFYLSLPQDLSAPETFTLNFPWEDCSQDQTDYYFRKLDFGNYSIHDDYLDRIATDLYWDTWIYYELNYPIREVVFGLYDNGQNEYVYQRYKQSNYDEFRTSSQNWLVYENLYNVFNLTPEPGRYQFRFGVEQTCLIDRTIEIFERDH